MCCRASLYSSSVLSCCFCFYDTCPPSSYTLSLHDALPISVEGHRGGPGEARAVDGHAGPCRPAGGCKARDRRRRHHRERDRKSTRLNSSHITISYAVFCLKKKTADYQREQDKQRRDIFIDQ